MNTVELVGRVIIALVVVVGLIYLIGKKARGGARRKLATAKLIDVLGRQSLSRNSSVAVVRVADQALIVGVTDSNVRVLGEIPLDKVAAQLVETDKSARLGSRSAAPLAGYDAPLDEAIPATPADLDGTLTAADIAALRQQHLVGTSAAGRTTTARRTAAAPPRTAAAPPRTAAAPPRTAAGPLSGSALSPATWRQTLDALREMTIRKG